jgi:F-type H+-transporting ATPase subunit gamma
MATRKEVKNRISSVKNVQKITRAMEMVAAARLRRAEQRIDALPPTLDTDVPTLIAGRTPE